MESRCNMKLKYKTNFTGYLPILRGIQLLLKNNTLNFTQLGAYICFAAQADFDRRHTNYRVILRDDYELAKEWGCSPSTVNRRRKELIHKGLLKQEDGLTKISNFYMFEMEWVKIFAKLPLPTLQVLFTKTQEEVAKEEFVIAKMKEKQLQRDTQSFNTSSKGELRLSNQDISDSNSDIDRHDEYFDLEITENDFEEVNNERDEI